MLCDEGSCKVCGAKATRQCDGVGETLDCRQRLCERHTSRTRPSERDLCPKCEAKLVVALAPWMQAHTVQSAEQVILPFASRYQGQALGEILESKSGLLYLDMGRSAWLEAPAPPYEVIAAVDILLTQPALARRLRKLRSANTAKRTSHRRKHRRHKQ